MLSNVFKRIAERLPDDVTVETARGGIDFNQAPPRIVFVPERELIGAPRGRGGDQIGQPSPLWTRRVAIKAHVWGKSQDLTEVLANHLVAAMHELLHGSYQLAGAEWLGGKVSDHGFVYVLDWSLEVPFTREPDWERPLTALPTTYKLNDTEV